MTGFYHKRTLLLREVLVGASGPDLKAYTRSALYRQIMAQVAEALEDGRAYQVQVTQSESDGTPPYNLHLEVTLHIVLMYPEDAEVGEYVREGAIVADALEPADQATSEIRLPVGREFSTFLLCTPGWKRVV